ncbi:MAG: hypothetical protein IPI58_06175 [Alphaproteobacteria bacterium]|nr:MAG: hypothetical protein IPI58_06175 [Alphaproteobacteria bacterium]
MTTPSSNLPPWPSWMKWVVLGVAALILINVLQHPDVWRRLMDMLGIEITAQHDENVSAWRRQLDQNAQGWAPIRPAE